MEFQKYNSLTNHYQAKFIQQLTDQGLSSGLWVATEKVHGSNFSFWFDGITLKTAKRSQFDDQFACAPKLVEQYKEAICEMYDKLIEAGVIEYTDTVVFYGEVFGGSYHGQKGVQAKTPQKGMHYHPETEFCLFDIGVQTATEKFWLAYNYMCELVDHTGMRTAPLIGEGDLQEMLELNNEFPTRVPEMYSLELPEGVTEHCTCEGLVIRPVKGERFLHSGTRAIIKSKNSKFLEKDVEAKQPKDFVLNDSDSHYFGMLSVYFNQARLEAVISKEFTVDDLSWKLIGKLSGLLIQDALADLCKDNEWTTAEFRDLLEAQKSFNRHVSNLSLEIVRQHLKTVL